MIVNETKGKAEVHFLGIFAEHSKQTGHDCYFSERQQRVKDILFHLSVSVTIH